MNTSLSIFTIKDDIKFMERNKDKFIKKLGIETYFKILKELKERYEKSNSGNN